MAKKKSAAELAEDLAELAHELRRRAGQETREDVAREIEQRFLGRPGSDRATYRGATPDDCLLEELAETPALQAMVDRFEEDGVSEDFRAGVLFAVRLFADPTFDY